MESTYDIIYTALSMRKNLIETGNSLYSATDLDNIGGPENLAYGDHAEKKTLSIDQMKLLIKIDKIMQQCLKKRTKTVLDDDIPF